MTLPDERDAGGGASGRRTNPGRHHHGLFLLLVGPDGSGKSSLASRLAELSREAGRPARHMHWRPGVLPQRASLTGRAPDSSSPHARKPNGALVSVLRVVYYWIDFFLGLHLRVQPIRARGGFVVIERGWWDFAVDPRRYRLTGTQRLVTLLGRLLPSPDIVMVLETTPELLRKRKTELPGEELSRQMAKWRQIELPRRTVRVELDASKGLDELVEEAKEHMLRVLKRSQPGHSAPWPQQVA
jgi:GTPase SAR1 family protein